jgi:hypothetical protein
MEGKLENTPLDEETARSYFKDAISGVEYRKPHYLVSNIHIS